MEIKYSRPWHFLHSCLGHLRRLVPTVRRLWSGGDPCATSNDHAVYAHYDREGVIHDYVIEQLRQLAATGFRVTFVTNAPRMTDETVSAVRPFCRQMIWRRGVGYDFGAYKDGIAALGDLGACDKLLLMNDSTYGPFVPLREVLNAANPAACDFWGITDSWEQHYHVQTYFVLFFRRALASTAFTKFWRRLPYVNSKSWVIRNGEVKLSQRLTRHKLSAAVMCPYWEVAAKALARLESAPPAKTTAAYKAFAELMHANLQFGRPMNSTHYFWDVLIADFGAPFIKRELIRLNPQGVIDAWRWPDVIGRHGDYDVSMIHRHLQAS